jgi:hypothetical protein
VGTGVWITPLKRRGATLYRYRTPAHPRARTVRTGRRGRNITPSSGAPTEELRANVAAAGERMTQPFPVLFEPGQRVVLARRLVVDPDQVPVGTAGTVRQQPGRDVVLVDYDNGTRRLTNLKSLRAESGSARG